MTTKAPSRRARAAVAPKWLSRKDAAAAYATSVDVIDELIASGVVLAKRLGERKDGRATRVAVSVASLDAWFDGLPEA